MEDKISSQTLIFMNDGNIYSHGKIGMPCFAVFMPVYLSYLIRDLYMEFNFNSIFL